MLLTLFKLSTFKDSTRIRKNILKYNFYFNFLILQSDKMLISAELKWVGAVLCVHKFFESPLGKTKRC